MFKSILNPDQSVLVGLATGGVVMAIYSNALPAAAAVRTANPQDRDIEGARKLAAWTSAGVLGFTFLLTRDRNSFLIGGLVLAGIDFLYKHSNGMNPVTGILDAFSGGGIQTEPMSTEAAGMYPLPDYDDADDGLMAS